MFLKLFLSVGMLLLSQSLSAISFPVKVTEYIDDVKIDAYINQADIDQSSVWIPLKQTLPLSVNEALTAVEKHLASSKEFAEMHLIGIELKPIPRHPEYWHYLVKIKVKSDGYLKPHFFVVLLSGKVISAIMEPDSIK